MLQPSRFSEIISANLICQVELLEAAPKPWGTDPANELNEARTVALTIRILDRIKGPASVSSDQVLQIDVAQRRPVSGREADDYGPWSRVALSAGVQLLTLCSIPAKGTVLTTLAEHCQLLITAENPTYPHAVQDTRRAGAMAVDNAFPASLQSAATQEELLARRQQTGPLFMRFLVAHVDELKPPPYPLLFRFLDAQETEPMSRVVIVDYFRDLLSLEDQPRADVRAPFIRSMTHILIEPTTSSRVLQEGIQQAFLYNATFDGSGQPYLPAGLVFPDAKSRENAVVAAKAIQDAERRARFISWLQSDY